MTTGPQEPAPAIPVKKAPLYGPGSKYDIPRPYQPGKPGRPPKADKSYDGIMPGGRVEPAPRLDPKNLFPTATVIFEPQPGPQAAFLEVDADIIIYGGSAGGGKSFGLMLESCRNHLNPLYDGVIFRRTYPQINNPGGLWSESVKLYPYLGAKSNKGDHTWTFASGGTVKFAHLQREDNIYDWMGSQIPFIAFDELTHFTEEMFFYMLSRNRSTSGIRPYVRATCNPDADSWVAGFIDWWIGPDGYAIPERSGIVRYFIRYNGKIIWADTPDQLKARYGDNVMPLSFTFILSTLDNNQILVSLDPTYRARLMALPLVEQERLLGDQRRGGNWKIKNESGKVFNRAWFEVVRVRELEEAALRTGATKITYTNPLTGEEIFSQDLDLSGSDYLPDFIDLPEGREVRFWDLAATEKSLKNDDPDWTASVKMRRVGDILYILDCFEFRKTPADTDEIMINTALQDGPGTLIRWEKEGGSSGVRDTDNIKAKFKAQAMHLMGFDFDGIRPNGDKVSRARLASQAAKNGAIKIVYGSWNNDFLAQLHLFPTKKVHDDKVDAFTGAFNFLTARTFVVKNYRSGRAINQTNGAVNITSMKAAPVLSSGAYNNVKRSMSGSNAKPANGSKTANTDTVYPGKPGNPYPSGPGNPSPPTYDPDNPPEVPAKDLPHNAVFLTPSQKRLKTTAALDEAMRRNRERAAAAMQPTTAQQPVISSATARQNNRDAARFAANGPDND